jgi:hypothetical protein
MLQDTLNQPVFQEWLDNFSRKKIQTGGLGNVLPLGSLNRSRRSSFSCRREALIETL